MGIRQTAKKLARRAGIALATTGLTTCNHGAVDPPPPPPSPLDCTTAIRAGASLHADGTATGTAVQIRIFNDSASSLTAVRITSVVGGSARPVESATPLIVVIDLTDDTVREGAFTLSGILTSPVESCAVTRRFTFNLETSGVLVALGEEPLLPERRTARIALVSREGHRVELGATTSFAGASISTWSVTGGEILSQDATHMAWRLPTDPGFYQVQLLVDYGRHGLAFDVLAFEVTANG